MSELNERKIFSKNLNTLLEKTGKSQKEVADAIHVSPQTLDVYKRQLWTLVDCFLQFFLFHNHDLPNTFLKSSLVPICDSK